ncbi:MAG: hypothetical protein ACXV2I_11145, partial [Actinomycetes bacterium]
FATQASNMLTELTREGSPVATPKPAPETDATPQREAESEPAPPEQPAFVAPPVVEREQADTAALLRELSSLGFGDDSSRPSSPPPSTPRSAPPALDPKKKRKGLFGRG